MNNIYKDILKKHIICCEILLKNKIINKDEFLRIEQKIKEKENNLNTSIYAKEEKNLKDSDYIKEKKSKFSFKKFLNVFSKTIYYILCLASMCISILLEDYFSTICFVLACFITLASIRKMFNIKLSNKRIVLIGIILYCIGIIELFYNI